MLLTNPPIKVQPAAPRSALTAVTASVDLPGGSTKSATLSLPLAIDTERLLDRASRNALTAGA